MCIYMYRLWNYSWSLVIFSYLCPNKTQFDCSNNSVVIYMYMYVCVCVLVHVHVHEAVACYFIFSKPMRLLAVVCGGMVWWCTCIYTFTCVLVCLLSFFFSFFFCALWCSIQVIFHIHVHYSKGFSFFITMLVGTGLKVLVLT